MRNRIVQVSNKEKQKTEEFNLLDKAERDLFTLMQSAVKISHEKEKIHTNSAKYWSIVGSLAGKFYTTLLLFYYYVQFDSIKSHSNRF